MKLLFTLAFVFYSLAATAALPKEEQFKIWDETGYSLGSLFSEEDFQPDNCLSSEKIFVGCVYALDTLLGLIEADKKELAISDQGQLVIQNREEVDDTSPRELEEILAKEKQQRETYQALYDNITYDELATIFKETQSLVEELVPSEEHAYIAGNTYSFFLTKAYDPHSGFQPFELMRPHSDNFFGMGAEIYKYKSDDPKLNGTVIVNPMKGSPAEAAGITKGDLIAQVDGVDARTLSLSEVAKRIRGEANTVVNLSMISFCNNPNNQENVIPVTRGPIQSLPDWRTDSKFISLAFSNPENAICQGQTATLASDEPQALYVPLTRFMQLPGQELCEDFVNLQKKDLENPNSEGIIFDIRNNGGGLLDAVTCMLNSIIKAEGMMVGTVKVEKGQVRPGEPVTKYRFNTSGPIEVNGVKKTYNRKITVLVNESSASASEVFSGSVQDMKRAWVIGERTLGKGSVQTYGQHFFKQPSVPFAFAEPLAKGMTTNLYTLPSGRSPQNFGVVPDFFYNQLGEEITNIDDYTPREAKFYNSIQYDGNTWEQTRGGEVSEIKTCATAAQSNSSQAKQLIDSEERFKRNKVVDFQLEMAKDVMLCDSERSDLH